MFKKYVPQIAQIFTNLSSKNMSHKLHKFSQILLRVPVFFANPFSCLFFAARYAVLPHGRIKKETQHTLRLCYIMV